MSLTVGYGKKIDGKDKFNFWAICFSKQIVSDPWQVREMIRERKIEGNYYELAYW